MHGSDEFLYSRDGVIQGDPLSMLLYAIGLLPLIRSLDDLKRVESWYADDSACVAQLSDLQSWFKKLSDMGPKYGYFPEARKSVLVVGEKDFSLAEEVIGSLGVKIVTGHRFLGGFVIGHCKLRFLNHKLHIQHCLSPYNLNGRFCPELSRTAILSLSLLLMRLIKVFGRPFSAVMFQSWRKVFLLYQSRWGD